MRKDWKSWQLLSVAVIIALAVGAAATPSGGGLAYEIPTQPSAREWVPQEPPLPPEEHLGPALPARADANAKLEASLGQLASIYAQGGEVQTSALSGGQSLSLVDGMVRLVATVQIGHEEEVSAAIAALGGFVEVSYGSELQFLAPLATGPAIADLPGVAYVMQPNYPVAQAVTSEGVQVIGADFWKAAGLRGKGVKVGIVDGGFTGYTGLRGTELPTSVTARSFRQDRDISGGGTVHGTAVAEIIYDIAPEADLYLANFQTPVEMGNAVDWLIGQGVNIISASIGFACDAPGDGTGTANALVAKARQAGVLWVNASGNEAQEHWSGFFSDTNGNGWHNFTLSNEGNAIYLTAGSQVYICLMWDDWTQRTQDFDLFLTWSSTGTILAQSMNYQVGSLPPVERIYYTAPATGYYGVFIGKYNAVRNVDFDLFVMPVDVMQYTVAARSILGSIPADSPNALTVGATNWKDDKLEYYSSQGPTKDGRIKPDISAPARVCTSSYGKCGGSGFQGTSAATPHVSGAAALVKSAFPSYSPAQLQAYLEAQALDMGTAGKDNQYGSGRLRLLALTPTPTATSTPTLTPTPTPTPTFTPSPTPMPTPTFTPSPTPTVLAGPLSTATPSILPTPTATPSTYRVYVPALLRNGGGW